MTVRLNPYLIFEGNAKEAVKFYERALGAQILGLQTFGEMPPDPNHPMPDDVKDRVMHAHLQVGETALMFSDTFPGQPHTVGTNVNVTLVSTDVETTKRIFEALSEGAQVSMPLQETFWSPAYGMLTDKFGVPWQITTETKQG